MTDSGTASSRPRPKTTGVVRHTTPALKQALGIDPERLLERGGRVALDDEPPFLDERVAYAALERRCVQLDFVAPAALRRIFVALAAAGRVKEWAEPLLRREDAVEDHLAVREAILLRAAEAAHRVARFERPLAAAREQQHRGGCASARRRHGARLFSSILSATRPVAVGRQSARTTSPGCRSPKAMAAPSPSTAVAGCVRMCTSRMASPTPMMISTVPFFTVCTVPW